MIIVNPVTQAMKNHFADNRVVSIDRVAAAGIIFVVPFVRFQHVIHRVFEPLEAEDRALLVPFTGVIEHHVQDDLDIGFVQCLNHLLELVHLRTRFVAGGVAPVRGEKSQWVVAPIIWPLRNRAIDVHDRKLVDRHQFNGGHSQRLQVRDLVDDAQVGSRLFHLAGFMLGESSHVRFVNDRIRKLVANVAIAFPIEMVVNHHAFGRPDNPVGRRLESSGQGFGVRVDQPGVGMKIANRGRGRLVPSTGNDKVGRP